MSNFHEQTYYELLEISPSASAEEVQQAYLRAKSIYAPDSPALYTIFNREEAIQLNQLLDEAFQTLSHHARRRDYDLNLQKSAFTIVHDKASETPATSEAPKYKAMSAEDKDSLLRRGIGVTRFGQYQIDSIIEQEINDQDIFDGTFLKRIREYKKINLEILCEHLKIGKHHFNAIENNDFSKLPASVFVRGYVKQLAETLGLDAKKVTDSYMKILKDVRDEK